MTKRKRIATYGRRGQLVRVHDDVHDGNRLVRVQWNEAKGAPLQTQSWPYSKANVATAKAFAEGTAQRLAAGTGAPLTERTIRELSDLHIAAFVESWAPATLRNFRHRWARLEAFVGRNTSAKLITEETLDEFRAKMREANIAVTQRGETVKAVKQVFRWAKRRKLIAENPLADYVIKVAKAERAVEVPEWTPEETGRLAARLRAERAARSSRHWRLDVAFAIASNQGARINAIRHLAEADVNLSNDTVRHPSAEGVVLSPRTVWWNPKFDKTATERVQPLRRETVRAIRIARVWRRRIGYAGAWLLAPAQERSRAKDEPWGYSAANGALRALVKRTPDVAWIDGRGFHGFRKFVAGEVHRVTNSERAAADFIGDRDIRVVRKHYLKRRAEEERGVAQKLDAGTVRQAPGADVAPIGGRPERRKEITHGTRTGYNRGCRCEKCTQANREHNRAARAKETTS